MDGFSIPFTLAERQHIATLPKKKAREWIDAKERSLAQALLDIHAMRNTLAPISSLPNEILAEIFWVLVRTCLEDLHSKPSPWLSLLLITKVCGTWRSVAIASAKLWALIHMRMPETAVKTFLHRSADMPLSIVIDGIHNQENLIIAMSCITNSHSCRIRSFEASMLKPGLMQNISQFCNHRLMPSLETLSLVQKFRRRIPRTEEAIIMDSTFPPHTPHLRRILLDGVSAVWSSSLFLGQLTMLELRSQNPSVSPSMTQFIHFLQNCPGLCTLVLIAAGPTFVDDEKVEATAKLNFLNQLTLSDNRPLDIEYLLSHLETPSDCKIFISCDVDNAAVDVLPADCSRLKSMNSLRWLQFQVAHTFSVNFRGRHTTVAPDDVEASLISFDCTAAHAEEAFFEPALLFKLPSILDLSHLEELELYDYAAWIPPTQWADFFASLPMLSFLSVYADSDLPLIRSLRVKGHNQQYPGLLCQRLRTLQLWNYTADDNVVNLCRDRAECGVPFKKLCVSEVSRDIGRVLATVVRSVEEHSYRR